MLCTFALDAYRASDASEVAQALDEIADPEGFGPWSSAGVYCFWDPETREVLYVGLAVDLAQRFRQHNGLLSCAAHRCKREKLEEWFASHDQIGFSVLLQSSLDQPACAKFNVRWGLSEKDVHVNYRDLLRRGHRTIVASEGLLIEAHLLAHGRLPAWNQVGGSLAGAEPATPEHIALLEIMTGAKDDWMTARKTIREIADNPAFMLWESYLHGIKIRTFQVPPSSFNSEFARLLVVTSDQYGMPSDEYGIRSEMLAANYLPAEWLVPS